MKGRKVLNLRTHLGGWLGKTSYDAVKDKCDMEINPLGVAIKSIKGEPILFLGKKVYCVSCNSNNIEFLVEADEEESKAPEAPKRGPGRPPLGVA